MFDLYTKYTFTMPEGVISDAGIRDIETYLITQDLETESWKKLNPTNVAKRLPYLPADWQWTWVIAHGEYAGTFPKRVSKWLHKVHKLTAPPAFLERLGQIARAHSSQPLTYTFDFANQIDWEDGDFGDSGSCWWGEYESSRVMWDNNNGLSIRFYDESGKGYGRAWLMQVSERLFTIMNGYGQGLSTLHITRIFAEFTHLTYKQIYLYNARSRGLWINNSAGYVVGDLDVIKDMVYHDFDMEGEYFRECYSCGRTITNEHDNYEYDGEYYCESCYYETFATCDECYQTYHQSDVVYVESEGIDVCNNCLAESFTLCHSCGEFFRNRNITVVGDKQYCSECLEDIPIEDEDTD